MRDVLFHFDFVSPYAWLALECARRFGYEHRVRWVPRPVVYAKLLEAHGLLGPAETEAKRRYTFWDVLRTAHRLGLRCSGPPAHPFRSLEALRLVTSFRTDPQAIELAIELAHACWADGRDLTDLRVLAEVVERVGLDASDVRGRIADAQAKDELRRITEEAVQLGIFGIPTFVLDGELFWGHDRLSDLADRLAGRSLPAPHDVERILSRPRAVVRPQAASVRTAAQGSSDAD